jgi:hypothetical protein
MKKFILFSVIFIFLASLGWGQATYIHVDGGLIWEDKDSWEDGTGNPVSNYPGEILSNDIVIINGTDVSISSSITLGTLIIRNNPNEPSLQLDDRLEVTNLIMEGAFHITGYSNTLYIDNITVNTNGEADGIIDMNGSIVQITNYPGTLTINPVNGNLGNINAGNRNVIITIPANSNITIGNIETVGNITINADTGSYVEISNIDAEGTVTTSGAGTVTNNNTSKIYKWTGTKSTVWTDNDNWHTKASPGNGGSAFIIIIDSLTHDPILDTVLECNSLTIQTNKSFNIAAYDLTVNTLDNKGNLILAGYGTQKIAITSTITNETVTYNNISGTNFAGLTNFKNLTIKNGERTVVGLIAVSGDFTLENGSLNATSINVTGTSGIAANITTSGAQTYSGVTLGGNAELTGSTVTFGFITGNSHSLTVTGNGVINGGSGIGSLYVSGTSNIAANVTSSGTQTYTGAVTLGGDVELTATTVTLGNITGGTKSLSIKGDGVLNGGSGIEDLTVNGDINLASGTLSATKVDVTGKSNITGNITTTVTQTYSGAVTLGGTNASITLQGTIVTLGTITGGGKSLTITGNGELKGGSGINVFSITGTSAIAGNITTAGNQTYGGAAIIDGLGSGSGKRTITSDSGDILFSNTLGAKDPTHDKIELLATSGKITVGGKITAYQLIAKAIGTVTVADITIDSSNTGNDGLNAAIYIEADNLITASGKPIIPGNNGTGQWGQLCLILNNLWTDSNNVVGSEDLDSENLNETGYSWHQHYLPLTAGMDLVYGIDPLELTAGTYIHIPAGHLKTTFILNAGNNVYINDAVNTNATGLVFITKGSGFIQFSGTNKFEKITLKTDSGGGINLVGANITVNDDFELNNGEKTTLDSNTGSSIDAVNITLNNITALNRENLTLKANSTSGEIKINGTVGGVSSSDYLGDITAVNANKVTFSGAIYARSTSVTSKDATIGADITTTGAQTYSGEVAFTGTGTRTLDAGTTATVTLGKFTGPGAGLSLTITGAGILNGGSGINALSVSGTVTVNADITTTGTQTYGEVTLGNDVVLTGTTVTLGAITGNGKSLKITGNGALSGANVINALTVSNNFDLTSGSLTAGTVSISGTSNIAGDITAAGAQTYTGAVTLSGSSRIITSQSGNIQFNSTLSLTGGIIKLSAANITISGHTTAGQLIAKAPSGTVSVNSITASTTGDEGENAAIYIEANKFEVTAAAAHSIVPGGTGGQLCLVLNIEWKDTNNIIDGFEEGDPLNPGGPFRWHQHIIVNGRILYSFTEDSNGNGRLDRIRVQTNVVLKGDFSGFAVSVDEYDVAGYEFIAAENDSFYIILIEKQELDGGNTPPWSIVSNTTLVNNAGTKVGDPAVDINIKPIDTIPPRIAYTLTLPGHAQTYVQMSEPVVNSSGIITASFGSPSVQITGQAEPDGLGYLFNLSGSFKIEDMVKDIGALTLVDGYFRMNGVFDKGIPPNANASDPPPKYPLDWKYKTYGSTAKPPPYELLTADMIKELAIVNGALVPTNTGSSVIRRVTDVLVSMPPASANSDNYFAWPVWARFKKSLNAPYSAGNDVFWGQQPTDTGIIWQFDGTNFLETNFIDSNDGLEIQARMNDNLPGAPVLFWTTSNIPAEYRNPKEATEVRKTGGLWLPNVFSVLYNYVTLSDGINVKPADSTSSKLFNYDLAANILNVESSAKFEFIFRLSNTSDMFIARLDIPRGAAIPDNWYALVRPFIFDIQNMRRQRGGVTVLNNVINSNNRETAFIRYQLTRPGRVNVQIYTLDGTLVKSLRRNEQRDAGEWTDSWDGTNNGGRAVARGMYFVRVVGPDIDEIRKIMVVK